MGELVCPRCGKYTAPKPATFPAQMTIRSGGSFRYERGTANAVTPDGEGWPAYGIMVCQACEDCFVAEKDYYNKWIAVYPLQHKPVARELPEPMKSELEEASLCFTIGAYRASVLMCETALEAIWHEQQVSGLKELRDKGTISEKLYKQANQVRRWANVAKHQLIHEVVKREEAEQLLSYVEQILSAVYVEEKRLSDLTEKLEQVEKKPKP